MNERNDIDMLRKFIRFEVDPELFRVPDFDDADNEEVADEVCDFDDVGGVVCRVFGTDELNGIYKPTCEDLVAACENMIKADIDIDLMSSWHSCVMFELEEYYDGCYGQATNYNYLWPSTEQDLFLAMRIALQDITFYDEFITSTEELHERLREIASFVTNYEYNRTRVVRDWKMTTVQKNWIMDAFADSTDHVPNSRRELFRRIVDEACEADDSLAMRIKGYGCYGGDKIYECDWFESRRLITKLFERTGDPTYANTLGYIYYYGRCNGGVPEYEKAFQYFSVGCAYHLLESTYKIADMFKTGKGCIKSPQTYEHIISELYDDCRNQFCHGSEAKFADVALRMAAIHMDYEDYREALACYLEADYDIRKRMKEHNFFGDKKVHDSIKDSLCVVKQKLGEDYFCDEVVMEIPYWLCGMVEGGINARFTIQSLGDNRYRMTVERRKKDHTGRALIVSNKLESVMLTRKMSCEFVTEEPIKYMCTDKSNMYVNDIQMAAPGELSFCNGDVTIFEIYNAQFILRKEDFTN